MIKFPHSYFLVFAQESIKEGAIGEALCAELPLVKSALSYVPLPAALTMPLEHLNLKPVPSKNVPIFARQ